ncbi:MAG: hypothetical protein ACRDZP_05290 [Acidimicrobiales bacterium]
MSLITMSSAKGSPGATTLSALLAHEMAMRAPSSYLVGACLIEFDPHGGDLSFMTGIEPLPGLASMAIAGRHGLDRDAVLEHSHVSRVLPRVAIIPGVSGSEQGDSLEWLAPCIAEVATSRPIRAELAYPVIVDVGRTPVSGERVSLLERAAYNLVVCRADAASLVHARSSLNALAARGIDASALVIGASSQDRSLLPDALRHPVAAHVPFDASVARNALRGRSASYPPSYSVRAGSRILESAIAQLADVTAGAIAPAGVILPDSRESAPEAVSLAAKSISPPALSRLRAGLAWRASR